MTIALAALLIWPIVTLLLFLSVSRVRAIIVSLLAGYLLLPINTSFDFQGFPAMDKSTLPSISTFLLAMALSRPGEFRWPRSPIVNALMATWVLSALLTGFANRDPVVIGTFVQPAMTIYSSFSMALANAFTLLPFVLGAGFLWSERAHRDLLLCFVLAALAYSLPVMVEVVKGPMFQSLIYRVDPGNFYSQQLRENGFRAIAFLGHGLLVSTFLALAFLAALGMWRARLRAFALPMFGCAAYLFMMLVLNKSFGAVIFAAVFGAMLILLGKRQFLAVALVLATMLVTYPMLRANQLIPVQKISELASMASQDRSSSLQFRLDNEDILLNRANERPLLGWGSNGRNRVLVFSEYSGATDISVTDGTWIIILGINGWLGYLAFFGLLTYPFLHLFKMRRRPISIATLALVAMLLLNILDLIPNSSLRPITWLIAGALAAFVAPGASMRRSDSAPALAAERRHRALVSA